MMFTIGVLIDSLYKLKEVFFLLPAFKVFKSINRSTSNYEWVFNFIGSLLFYNLGIFLVIVREREIFSLLYILEFLCNSIVVREGLWIN